MFLDKHLPQKSLWLTYYGTQSQVKFILPNTKSTQEGISEKTMQSP